MIGTLRITSVAAVILAGVVMASVVGPVSLLGFGVRDDTQVAKFLDGPSAVDRFKERHGDKAQDNQDTTPPLVKQAELFANIINPPASAPAQTRSTPAPAPRRPKVPGPPAPSAQFGLVGTSYSPNADESFAYVRLADNTYQWVRPGDEIGHIVVKQIKNGAIVCWDGSRDAEMAVEPVPETASLLETGGAATTPVTSGFHPPAAVETRTHPMKVIPSSASSRLPAAGAPRPSPYLTEEDHQALGDLVERLKKLDMDPASRAAAVNELISELKSSRVSPEEAEKLESLGQELNENDDKLREERRRELLRRLSSPRPARD
jgi:hypothetical protein